MAGPSVQIYDVPSPLSGLTTSTSFPLPAWSTVLLDGSSLRKFLGDFIFQTGHSDQETLLIDGLLQCLDVRLHLLLHPLSQAAQITAAWFLGKSIKTKTKQKNQFKLIKNVLTKTIIGKRTVNVNTHISLSNV